MQTIEQLDLAHFTGSETFSRWTMLSRSVLTEGTKYVAEELGAYWLFDAIDSHLTTTGLNDNTEFTVAKLVVKDGKAVLTLDDGNDKVWRTQRIPYTDFPEGEFSTYAIWNGQGWTHLLKSEY